MTHDKKDRSLVSLKPYLAANNKETTKQNTDIHSVFSASNDGCKQTTANHGHLALVAGSGRPTI